MCESWIQIVDALRKQTIIYIPPHKNQKETIHRPTAINTSNDHGKQTYMTFNCSHVQTDVTRGLMTTVATYY
jgi:hypothetical protein